MKVFVKGLHPCAVRKVKVMQYADFLAANGHSIVERPEDSDMFLVWSCGFRSDFIHHSVNTANSYKALYGKPVVLCGCAPDIDPDFVHNNFDGQIVSWRDDAVQLANIFGDQNVSLVSVALKLGEERLISSVRQSKQEDPDKDACYLDESIKLFISEGCKQNCSFCTEKQMFPPYRSFSEDELVATTKEIIERTGEQQVMLQADSLGDYGSDFGSDLPSLLDKLFAQSPHLQLGLQGFNPAHFIMYFDYLMRKVGEGKIFHLRLPIQSATDRMLSRMRRTYTRLEIERIFASLRDADFDNFSTDLIVGFPGEEEYDFLESLDFVLSIMPRYVLLSAYMDSRVLPSYAFDGKVPDDIKRRRLLHAERMFNVAGIHCSCDTGALSQERQRCLSLV